MKHSFSKLPLVLFLAMAVVFISACTPKPPMKIAFSDLQARITPHMKIFKAVSSPAPTILLFHGASKGEAYDVRYKELSERLQSKGFSVVFVNMFRSRNTTGHAVYNGNLLPKETAGDVMAATQWARNQPWIDQGRLYALGYSFGGATLMDSLVRSKSGTLPDGLLDRPESGVRPLKAIAVVAPWCKEDVMGFNLIASVHEDFGAKVPLLGVLPMADSISDQRLCTKILERNKSKGFPVELYSIKGAKHKFWFDKAADGSFETDFDGALTSRVLEKIVSFFSKHAA